MLMQELIPEAGEMDRGIRYMLHQSKDLISILSTHVTVEQAWQPPTIPIFGFLW